MEGVILFADDKVFGNSFENEFFRCLVSEKSHPVLGVDSLELLEKTVGSISTYKALIVDWNFNTEEDVPEGIVVPNETPASFLLDNEIYSLIYIYSDKQIELTDDGKKLIAKYGNKIKFKQKNNSKTTTAESASSEKQIILDEILAFEKANPNLQIPFIWSKSINRATQEIFHKLEFADPNWISELYRTASNDPVEPSVEVINLFQNILSEYIIQDKQLSDKIKEIAIAGAELTSPEDYAKVIRILYYSKVKETAPIMTGDIIRLDTDKYGIIITPECDIRHVLQNPNASSFEMLCFSKGDYHKSDFKLQATIKPASLITRAEQQKDLQFTAAEKTELSQLLNSQIKIADTHLQVVAFTQTNPKIHLLPCFEFDNNDFSGISKIDFRSGLIMQLGNTILVNNRIGKLNTPYIQELRQRYYAYKGRVGVPNPSRKMREWLLDKN